MLLVTRLEEIGGFIIVVVFLLSIGIAAYLFIDNRMRDREAWKRRTDGKTVGGSKEKRG